MTDQNKQEMAGRQSALDCGAKAADLQTLSQRNLWEVLLFILISIAAVPFLDMNLLDSMPADIRAMVGYPAPAYLVTAALAVYSFSATMILLAQMANCSAPQPRWSHLGYRSMFFFFYAVAGALANHFMAVFFIGILLYGAEQVHILIHCSRAEQRDKKLLSEP